MKRILLPVLFLASLAMIAAFAFAGGGGGGGAASSSGKAPSGVDVSISFDTGPVEITVTGTVTDAQTGAPLAGATVNGHVFVSDDWQAPDFWPRLAHGSTVTDGNGAFTLTLSSRLGSEGSFKGRASVCIDAGLPGYETRPLYLRPEVTREKTSYGGVKLALRKGVALTGLVVDSTGRPVEGTVVKRDGDGNGDWTYFASCGKTTTGADGRFELWVSRVADQEYPAPRHVEIRKDGLGVLLMVVGDQNDLGTITMPPTGTITGRVLNEAGAPVAGCEVAAGQASGFYFVSTKSDRDGRYEIKGLPGLPSLRDFYMKRRGDFASWLADFTVFARANSSVSFDKAPQYKITPQDGVTLTGPDLVVGRAAVCGRIVGSGNGLGLEGRAVDLDGMVDTMTATDKDGRFELAIVPEPGTHVLTVQKAFQGRITIIGTAHFTAEEGKPVGPIDIPLYPVARVDVLAVDAAGRPLEGVNVDYRILPDIGDAWSPGAKTGADGIATLFVPPGIEQFIRATDYSDRKLRAADVPSIRPAPNEIVNLRVAMVEPAGISGRLMTAGPAPVAGEEVFVTVNYADGTMDGGNVTTDSNGRFEMAGKLRPGVATASVESPGRHYSSDSTARFELTPGSTTDIGDVACKRSRTFKVSGRVVPSKSITNPGFLHISDGKERLFLAYDVTRSDGTFSIPAQPEGRCRLGAYQMLAAVIPGQRPLGFADIDVRADIDNVVIRLDNLVKVNVEIVDTKGQPVRELCPVAWPSRDRRGIPSTGTETGHTGKAFLYVPANRTLYVSALDNRDKAWVTVEDKEVTASSGETVDGVRIVVKHAWE